MLQDCGLQSFVHSYSHNSILRTQFFAVQWNNKVGWNARTFQYEKHPNPPGISNHFDLVWGDNAAIPTNWWPVEKKHSKGLGRWKTKMNGEMIWKLKIHQGNSFFHSFGGYFGGELLRNGSFRDSVRPPSWMWIQGIWIPKGIARSGWIGGGLKHFVVFISGEMMQFDQNFSHGLKPHQLGSVWMDLVGFVWPNSHILTVLDGNRTKIIDDVSKKSVVPCSLFRNGFTAHFGEFMMSDSKIVGSMAGHHGAAFDLSKSFIDLRCFLKNPRNRGYTQ